MDYFSMSLEEIEEELNIQPFEPHLHKGEQLESSVFDDWEAVASFLKKNRNTGRVDLSFSCYGYELVYDNHYIKIYYRISHSYS